MHILEIPSFFDLHGGLFCLEQAKALQRQGHEVRILACSQVALTVDGSFFLKARCDRWWEQKEGVDVYRTYMRAMPRSVHWNMERWVRLVMSMYRNYVKRYGRPDVLHAHCAKWAGVAAMRLSTEEDIPYFVTEHLSAGLLQKDFGKGWSKHLWAKDVLREVYEKARCVIPVARELVDDLTPFFGSSYRYKVISNIIDTDFFAFHKRLPSGNRPFRYCLIARADIHGKGFDVLAEAWKKLEAESHIPVELYMAGAGTDSKEVKDLFAGCRSVHGLGFKDKSQIRQLLYDSDALVLPSRSEAQPLVIMEALATGIPAVATEIVPQSERIPGGCLIVPVGDAVSFAEAMKQVQGTAPSEDFSRGVTALASPQAVARQLSELFQSAL